MELFKKRMLDTVISILLVTGAATLLTLPFGGLDVLFEDFAEFIIMLGTFCLVRVTWQFVKWLFIEPFKKVSE